MSGGVEIDADSIAAAVRAIPAVAGLDGGRFGEIATYLPGRRVRGVRIGPDEVTIGVIGRYPATITEIDAAVRAAVGLLDRPVHVTVLDIAVPGDAPGPPTD
ncbi:hypothetical protein [Amycolatopsis anabasis]|uniref:hypothetical protein n=1 Tax=Amycolatopsis anabasis TaxID=1840409 RepID=UPI00131E1EA2|nr:hypothetical protein [Amycolatopsis anabasis]